MKYIKKKKCNVFILEIAVCIFFSSCASILNTNYQKVKIVIPEESKVLINNREGEMKNEKYLLKRDAFAKQIAIVKEGFKNQYYAPIQFKPSPYYLLSVVPGTALFFIPPAFDGGKKSNNYKYKLDCSTPLLDNSFKHKYNAILTYNDMYNGLMKSKAITERFIPYRKYAHDKIPNAIAASVGVKEVVLNNDIENILMNMLENESYISRNSTIPNEDKIRVRSRINSLTYNDVENESSSTFSIAYLFGHFIYVELNTSWEVYDNEDNLLFSYNDIETKSGEFAYSTGLKLESYKKAVYDALEISFIKFSNRKEFVSLMDKKQDKFEHVINQSISKKEATKKEEEKKVELIKLEKKGHMADDEFGRDFYSMVKGSEIVNLIRDSGAGNKAYIELVRDVPELYSYAKKNYHKGKGFANGLAIVYNDYVTSSIKPTLNQNYFDQFGLITKKEWRSGPTEEKLKIKQPIKGEIKHFRVTTTNYTNGMETGGTVGENYRFNFSYGNVEYKKGFLLSNLKKCLKNDPEALKYINTYRKHSIARTAIFGVGWLQLYGAFRWGESGKSPFGLSDGPAVALLAPGLFFLNWHTLFPQNYKTKNIAKAIETYNINLIKKK